MFRFVRPVRSLTLLLLCACLCLANAGGPLPQQPSQSWLAVLWDLPIVQFFTPLFGSPELILPPEPVAPAPVCSVPALDPIEDPAAQQLEADSGFGNGVDLDGMMPAAARALDRFQSKVAAAGGTMILKSAYRPAAYQQHLQNVWHTWMNELRDNQEPACENLRAQVQEEFTRHRLIESQHPVSVSDHTRGVAFDATVDLPGRARLGGRRVTLDRLARLSGLLRPAIVADPVHFKFVGAVSSRRVSRVNRRWS